MAPSSLDIVTAAAIGAPCAGSIDAAVGSGEQNGMKFAPVALLLCFASAPLLLGCGSGGEKPAVTPDTVNTPSADSDSDGEPSDSATEEGKPAPKPAPKEAGIPTECERMSGDICLPPKKFVAALCAHDYPTVALAMFTSGSPWKRAYLAAEVRAWDASGGGASNEKIPVDEEVIVVRHRQAKKTGIQVSGAGNSYDVMRWDGSCATLDAGELRFDEPPKPRNARIIWSRIELDVRDMLKEQEAVRETYLSHRRECKGVSVGSVSKACVKADGELSRVIAKFVREQGGLPAPKKLPEL